MSAILGLAASLLFLEVWNFFAPINHASVGVLGGFALGLAILLGRTVIGVLRDWIRGFQALAAVSLLLLLLTVSLFGLGPSEHGHYDTGLYYLNAIRWAREYPVVPGLANLHSRLAYNQSLFLFVAFVANVANLGLARACQIVNPIFVFISCWAVLDRLKVKLGTKKERRGRVYAILLLCPIFFLASDMLISAPTSDIAVAAVALPAGLALCCCLEEIFDRNQFEATNWLLLLTVLGGMLIKLKLSYSILAGAAIGLACVAFVFIGRRKFLRLWIRAGILAAIMIIPWAARGVLLSGYPFYPLAVLRFRTDWALPRKTADTDRDWIYSWAKTPGKLPQDVLYNDAWFGPWIERNAKYPENVFLFWFNTAGLVSAVMSLAIPMRRKQRLLAILLMLPSALAVVSWFKTAPDPRFAYGTLLLLGVSGFYAGGAALSGLSKLRAGICACGLTGACLFLIFNNQWPLINPSEKKFPHGFPKAVLLYQTTDSGLLVGIADQQAWDSDLVVTPYFNPDLVLRGRGLRDGFRINQAASSPNFSGD